MGAYVKWTILIIILAFFITFGVENSQIVNLNYYGIVPLTPPLYALCYFSILIGILVGMGIGLRNRFRLRRQIRDLEKGEGIEDRAAEGAPANDASYDPNHEQKEQ